MATINVHKNGPTSPKAPLARAESAWEPFRGMRDLLAWDPFREMSPFAEMPSTFMPSFEVKETKDAYVFKADVPGIKDNDIDVSLTGSRLTISGKREEEKKEQTDTYYTYERSYGSFTRSFTLPEGIVTSSIAADLKDGVLTINVKKAPEAIPQKIAVQGVKKP
jgi:HSP20 family protein